MRVLLIRRHVKHNISVLIVRFVEHSRSGTSLFSFTNV